MRTRELVAAIRQALDTGAAEQAYALAQELLRRHPDYPTAYLLLVRALVMLRRWQEAEELVQRAQASFPRHPFVRQLQQEIQRCREEAPSEVQLRQESRDVPEVTVPLRLVEGFGDATVRLRSTVIRLIPGLEFAPLRSALVPAMWGWAPLPPPPPFPEHLEQLEQAAAVQTAAASAQELSPLEELAQRLERARILPPEEEEVAEAQPEEPEEKPPLVATETLARIYEQQGAYEQALRVYDELARRYPEKRSLYEQAQARVRQRMQDADS